jgi:ATP-dependent DNA helicase RecG
MNLHVLQKSDESETLEFKEKFDERTVESAVAFANAKCNMIFIGISGDDQWRKNDSFNCSTALYA